MNRIKELEDENQKLKDMLDIAVKRRECIEEKIFESFYLSGTIAEELMTDRISRDITKDIDKQITNDIVEYCKKIDKKTRTL